MQRGIITAARDFLFAGWKGVGGEQGSEAGWLPVGQQYGTDQTAIRASDYAGQIAANKGTIYACTKLLGNAIAATPLRIYRAKQKNSDTKFRITRVKAVPEPRKIELLEKATPGSALSQADDVEEIVAGHRLVDLLFQVNSITDHFGLKFLTSSYISLCGNCYWVLLRDRRKIPSAIWVAPAEYMKVIPDQDTLVAGYLYKHGQVKKRFERDEVVHIKLPAPGFNFLYYGRGDVMGVADAYNLSEYIQAFEESIFKNNAFIGGVISTTASISETERKRLEAKMEEYKLERKANKLLIMKDAKFEQMSMTPKDLAYGGSKKGLMELIANGFLIPIALLTGQTSTRAGLEASLTQVAMFAAKPQCTLITEALNAQLCPLYPDNVSVEFDNPVPEDKEFELKETESDIKLGIRSIDEQRKKKGWEPWGGAASGPIVDANRVPLSMLGEIDTEGLAEAVAQRVLEMKGESENAD